MVESDIRAANERKWKREEMGETLRRKDQEESEKGKPDEVRPQCYTSLSCSPHSLHLHRIAERTGLRSKLQDMEANRYSSVSNLFCFYFVLYIFIVSQTDRRG